MPYPENIPSITAMLNQRLEYAHHTCDVMRETIILLKFIVITMINKFAECYKTLVDCFFDVGQFQNRDNVRTEKPFGPFAKLLD